MPTTERRLAAAAVAAVGEGVAVAREAAALVVLMAAGVFRVVDADRVTELLVDR